MKCHPWRWLWGLLPLAIWTWITVLGEHERIEADLRRRSQEALRVAGLGWAGTTFSGRDGILTGRAAEENEPVRALRAMRGVWGVRLVDARTEVAAGSEGHVWSAALRDSGLRISGVVPDEDTRKAIVGVAKANFPQFEVDDRMKLAPGAAPDGWFGAVGFALKLLAKLQRGTVEFRGRDLSVSGQAENLASYRAAKTALRHLPHGIRLVGEKLSPPVASPFAWAARTYGSEVVLSGFVPSEMVRAELLGACKRLFPHLVVVDRMDTAAGAPAGWDKAALALLEQIAQLGEASAEVKDRAVLLSGEAGDAAVAGSIDAALRAGLPAGFDVKDVQLTLKAPEASRGQEQTGDDEARRAREPHSRASPRTETAAIDALRQDAVADRCQEEMRQAVSSGVIHFARASAELEYGSRPTLDELVRIAKTCPKTLIEIEGHTDAEGTPERNARLSKRRAEAVAEYLADAGIEEQRLSAVGYGETRPVAPNDTADNRARNRRIEFAVRSP